ncbi:MAG: hypothetical protein IPJ13_08040 [Saprospiraceae bacterium]|nr:hypothetical protein [Saprospiraceae bacterium]
MYRKSIRLLQFQMMPDTIGSESILCLIEVQPTETPGDIRFEWFYAILIAGVTTKGKYTPEAVYFNHPSMTDCQLEQCSEGSHTSTK